MHLVLVAAFAVALLWKINRNVRAARLTAYMRTLIVRVSAVSWTDGDNCSNPSPKRGRYDDDLYRKVLTRVRGSCKEAYSAHRVLQIGGRRRRRDPTPDLILLLHVEHHASDEGEAFVTYTYSVTVQDAFERQLYQFTDHWAATGKQQADSLLADTAYRCLRRAAEKLRG